MCGIAGKISNTSGVERELIARMCHAMEHRGPDSRGIFLGEGVGLGVQRLRVIDLETGDQPIANEDGSVIIALNGEIYNYCELRTELKRRGHLFSTAGDTEVIVHLYEDHGLDCVRYLRGMFAFALWDQRQRQLVLARDRVGKKPLFYAEGQGSLSFASEVRALLEDQSVERRVDLDAIDAYLHFQYVPHPLSAFAGVNKLPPAHTLVWRDGVATTSRYWRLSYRPRPEIVSLDRAGVEELIREELLEATRVRLRSDVPLGAFLSGGVDSSAVVAAMAQEVSGRVKTFSIGFDVPEFDETTHAREVARLFDTDHHELRVEPSAMAVLPRLVWHYGEPFADSSAIPSFYLARLTREHVTVALNGDGGDENFAGYSRYLGTRLAARAAGLSRPVRRALRRAAQFVGPDGRENSFRSRFDRLTRAALLDPCDRYSMWIAYFAEHEREALYTPEMRAALRARPSSRFVCDAWRDSDAQDGVNRLLSVDVETYLPGDLLVKMDIATMAHSLEVRSPLLDQNFMELCAGLPGDWKLDALTTKRIFKDALRAWLPTHLVDRRKAGFGVPIASWFRSELCDLPRDILLDRRSLERGFFREEAIRQLIDRHVDGTRDNAYKIWALVQLELWLRTFVDSGRSTPLTIDVGRHNASLPVP